MKTHNPAHKTVIRPATIEDIPAVIERNREGILSWGATFQSGIQEWMDSVCRQAYFDEMIFDPQKVLLVAEFEGKICGTAYGYPKDGPFYVGGMYLSIHGQGIAALLLGELIRVAKHLGYTEMAGEIYEHNHEALRFFRRHGWVQGKTERFNGINFHTKILVLH